jgi:cytochrome c oxidase cbb3-type subunit 3
MSSRCRSGAVVALGLAALCGCQREQRNLRPAPTRLAIYNNAAPESTLIPGGSQTPPVVANPSHGNAYDISEGQRLYNWYNCSGCHFNGGGGIGPPLIKTQWIYGGEPANLFDTIVKGRPNGMPTWGGRIPENQIWQIVAYVRSMNHEEPQAATPQRPDTLETNPQTIRNPVPGSAK